MNTRNTWLIGCGAVVFLVLISGGILYLRWTAPPDVPIPPLPSPPGNAYPIYLQLVQKTRQLEASTPGLEQLVQRATQPRADASILRRYIAAYDPVRREYRKHLSKPSVVTAVKSMDAMMRVAPVFRTWARVEAADIRLALQEGDYRRAIDDLRTTLLLAEAIRNGAPFMQYLVGEAMIVIATAAFAEGLEKLSPAECDRLVRVVREWEQVHVPYWKALEGEKRFTIAMYHAMYEGGERMTRFFGAPSRAGGPRYAGRLMNLRLAAREVVELYDKAIAEAKKPLLRRQPLGITPKHPLNQSLLASVLSGSSDKSTVRVARLRLLACAAAVRAYRMRHGRYPRTLAEAGVADLNKDPITGGEFIYRTGVKGFLLYSVGMDGKDDGGKRVPEAKVTEGTGDLAPVPYRAPRGVVTPGAAPWLR